ncbi:hypothetical protein XaFJ1_GM002346 [Xanthomonas albilineans]|nr:hypothetical protein XaFJ1_GM002346 [Xanthomonas albilineans]
MRSIFWRIIVFELGTAAIIFLLFASFVYLFGIDWLLAMKFFALYFIGTNVIYIYLWLRGKL